MGEAARRKAAGNTKPKGRKWRVRRPSRFVKWLVAWNSPNRKWRRDDVKAKRAYVSYMGRITQQRQEFAAWKESRQA